MHRWGIGLNVAVEASLATLLHLFSGAPGLQHVLIALLCINALSVAEL